MEKGRLAPGVLLGVNEGGSTRLKGELEARRLDRSPTRLCLGEPRVREIGVEFVVLGLGEERALRTEGTEGVAKKGAEGVDCCVAGEETTEREK